MMLHFDFLLDFRWLRSWEEVKELSLIKQNENEILELVEMTSTTASSDVSPTATLGVASSNDKENQKQEPFNRGVKPPRW